MTTIFALFLICVTIWYLLSLRRSVVELKYLNNIKKIRMDLDDLVVENKVDINSNVYDYFSFVLDSLVQSPYRVSVSYIVLFLLINRFRLPKSDIELMLQIESELNKNPSIAELNKKKYEAMIIFLKDQNPIIYRFFKLIGKGIEIFNHSKRGIVSVVVEVVKTTPLPDNHLPFGNKNKSLSFHS